MALYLPFSACYHSSYIDTAFLCYWHNGDMFWKRANLKSNQNWIAILQCSTFAPLFTTKVSKKIWSLGKSGLSGLCPSWPACFCLSSPSCYISPPLWLHWCNSLWYHIVDLFTGSHLPSFIGHICSTVSPVLHENNRGENDCNKRNRGQESAGRS